MKELKDHAGQTHHYVALLLFQWLTTFQPSATVPVQKIHLMVTVSCAWVITSIEKSWGAYLATMISMQSALIAGLRWGLQINTFLVPSGKKCWYGTASNHLDISPEFREMDERVVRTVCPCIHLIRNKQSSWLICVLAAYRVIWNISHFIMSITMMNWPCHLVMPPCIEVKCWFSGAK